MDAERNEMTQSDTKRITVALEADQLAWIESEAAACKLTQAQYIRMRLAQLQAAEVAA
jgi:uncharacterized protein YecT (DUF1311 family)